MWIRDATVDDLPAITDLFNAHIATTTIAWRDLEAPLEEIGDWFASQTTDGHPVLVAEVEEQVAGYCCWSAFRGGPRFPGYRHTVEQTVHVADAVQRTGVGRALIAALIDRAREDRVHVLVAGIDGENLASLGLHRALGYVEVARMPEVGRKFDRWLDLVLMQLIVP